MSEHRDTRFAPPRYASTDDLAPARGMVFGLLLSMPIWFGIGMAVWWLTH